MIDVINNIVNCLQLPYVIFSGLCAFVLLWLRQYKWLFVFLVLIIFSTVWRTSFNTYSSRYCLLYFIYLLFISIVIFSLTQKRKSLYGWMVASLITAALLTYNIIKCFSPFRDIYVYDIKETITEESKSSSDTFFFITPKESTRLRDFDHNSRDSNPFEDTFDISNDDDLSLLLDSFTYWGHKYYLILSRKKQSFLSFKKSISESCEKKIIQACYTNKRKDKVAFVLSVSSLNHKSDDSFDLDYSQNSIKNGNFEDLLDYTSSRKRFDKIISYGATFYNDNFFQLPAYVFLIPNVPHKCYPVVFSESTNPIEGKSSLYISFLPDNTCPIYLLNKVNATNGVLSFSVRSLSDKSIIYLGHRDFISDSAHNSKSYYYFFIDNKDTYRFNIPFSSSSFSGSQTLFFIFGNDSTFLIDNISFVPLTEQPTNKDN